MTYNATSANLVLAQAGGLIPHVPLYEIPHIERAILLPPELKRKLRNETPSDIPYQALALPIAQFMRGQSFTVSQKNRPARLWKKRTQPNFERLEGFDEVWVFCHRRPGAGWRMVGRFLEKNVFVLLDIKDKRDIGSNYEPVAAQAIASWNTYLPAHAPLNGEWINGYLSGSHYDVDQEKQIGTP